MYLANAEYSRSAAYFHCNPFRVKAKDSRGRDVADFAFKGLLVLQTNVLSSMNGASPPAWAGIWQQHLLGFRDIIRIDNRLFVWTKSYAGNRLVEIVEGRVDKLFNREYKVKSRVYTRALGARHLATDKELQKVTGELSSFDLQLGLDIKGYYRPFHAHNFIPTSGISLSADDSLACAFNVASSGLIEFVLGRGDTQAGCDMGTGSGLQFWRKAEVLLEITGEWELNTLFAKYRETAINSLNTFGCDQVATALSRIDCDFINDFNIEGEVHGN